MRAVALLAVFVLVAGCLGADEPAPPSPREDVQTDDASTRPVTEQFTGSATGTPAAPTEQVFEFEVPRGAVGVNGTLTYERPPVELPTGRAEPFQLELLDPDGELVASGYRDVDGRLIVVTVEPPKPGTWTFVVRAVSAIEASFTLDAVAELIVPANNLVQKSLTLGQASFYEVNLILEEGASFAFSFNASAPLRWDVHSHPPEGLKEWETGEGPTGAYTFNAPHRDVYSILWENQGAFPAELAFEVTGAFRIHSHSG